MEMTGNELLLELSGISAEGELRDWCHRLKTAGGTLSCTYRQVVPFLMQNGQGIEMYYRILRRLQDAYNVTEDEEVRHKISTFQKGLDLEHVQSRCLEQV